MIAALLAAAALAVPGHGTAGTAGTTVDIPGRYFAPAELQVLVGDTVAWRNADHTGHTVVADGHAFASERIDPGGTFSVTFDEPGSYDYHCSLHRSMRGTVTVSALGLTGPDATLRRGEHATFEVLAPAGTPSVQLERVGEHGSEVVGDAVPGADGRAAFHVHATEPGRYRARAGTMISAEVPLRLAPTVTATARWSGGRVTVSAAIDPPLPGATVALKRYVRERFTYVPVRTTRTADGTGAKFRVRTRRRIAVRVGVTAAPGGWSAADSRLLILRAR